MARLLAGTGVSQILAAEELAGAAGIQLDPLPGTALPGSALPGSAPASPVPPSPATPSSAGSAPGSPAASCTATTASGGADVASSLTALTGAEQELVYAYQAALTRLNPASVQPASDFLTQHEGLRREAEAAATAHCAALPPAAAGYAVDAAFLTDPAAALGTLEAGTLPLYGDLIALSSGSERSWALGALQSAARRTVYWGASPGPAAGLVLDAAALPPLPALDPSPSASSTPSPGTP